MFLKKLCLFISFVIIYNTLNAQDHIHHEDIINISKIYFKNKLKIKKEKTLYIELNDNNTFKQFFKDSVLNVSFKDKDVLKKHFQKQQIKHYLSQVSEENNYKPYELESDNIFVYNKNRDLFTIKNNQVTRVSENNIYKMCIPVFSQDNKYAIFLGRVPYTHFNHIIIYKRNENNTWGNYRSASFSGF